MNILLNNYDKPVFKIMDIKKKARLLTFYLPQYHPIPENDTWWGKGFTEWTNVTKAKPLFPGHYQPRLPADLGFYDLRVPETRIAQAEIAREYGIEGFCYWHYWFGNGKRILERPFNEVLKSGEPNFPFCLAWANDSWTGIWYGSPNTTLIQQLYPGKEDYEAHFNSVLPAFTDDRYIKVDGKPLFVVFKPDQLPNKREFTDYWRELADKAGLPGIYFVGIVMNENWDHKSDGFDGFTSQAPSENLRRIPKPLISKILYKMVGKDLQEILRENFSIPRIYEYSEVIKYAFPKVPPQSNFLPSVLPNWDNTPRSQANGVVYKDSTPELFRNHLRDALNLVATKPDQEKLIFVKSWNEWAEGNYLEPDREFGKSYLEVVKSEVFSDN